MRNTGETGWEAQRIFTRNVLALIPERDGRKQVNRKTTTEVHLSEDGWSLHHNQTLGTPLNAASSTGESAGETTAGLRRRQLFILSFSEPNVLTRDVRLPAASMIDADQILALDTERISPFKRSEYFGLWSHNTSSAANPSIRHAVLKKSMINNILASLGARASDVACIAIRDAGGVAWQRMLAADGNNFGYHREKSWQRASAAAAVAAVAAGILVAVIGHNRIDSALDSTNAELLVAEEKAKAVRQQITRLLAENKKTEAVTTMRSSALIPTRLFEEISGQLPDSAWIQSFTIRGTTVQIEGQAQNAEALIALLEKSPLLKDVKFASPILRYPGETKSRFAVSFGLDTESGSTP